jgi:3-methylfumaryl-CoA hydratase
MHDTPPSTSLTDTLDPARASALHATLNRPGPTPQAGDPLPPFWHQIYFWDAQPPGDLGVDGHAKQTLTPDLPDARRMWAGGQLSLHAPVLLGQPATKTVTLDKVTRKQGRSGPLVFVTLRHDIHQGGRLCVTEMQDLVYKTATGAPAETPQAPTDETHATPARFDTTLLFRYSALTFNGHRIHYDAAYARDHEGYDGLVVHGPLMAQLLVHLAESQIGALKAFHFRAISPLMHHETADLCWRDGALWIRGPGGKLVMQATAR